jgi:hypothetical protein
LRYQEEENPITDMYIALLARAMDRERVGEAHPAFIPILGQLAPDEALLIDHLAAVGLSTYWRTEAKYMPPTSHVDQVIGRIPVNQELRELLLKANMNKVKIAEPKLLYTYIEHLLSLGVVSYTNDPWSRFGWSNNEMKAEDVRFWFLELNGFGQLLHKACLGENHEAL